MTVSITKPVVGGSVGTWGPLVNTALDTLTNALNAIPIVPTAVKTSAYTASANELVPVNTTSGNVTITLPTGPADGSRVTVKHVIQGGSNTVTVTRGGSADVFNKTGGSTSMSLTYLNQAVTFQYQSGGGIWYVVGDDLPVSAVQAISPLTTVPISAYAQAGDADDTAAINRAIAAAQALYVTGGSPVEVSGDSRKRYLISSSGTVRITQASGSAGDWPVGVKIPTGVVLSNTYLKRANSSAFYLVANANPNTEVGSRDHSLGLKNVTLDDNGVDLFASQYSLAIFTHMDDIRLLGTVRVTNGAHSGLYAFDVHGGVVEDVIADNWTGSPLQFGTPVTRAWAATTAYTAGTVVSQGGAAVLYSAKTTFTSGSVFDASNWDALPAGSTVNNVYDLSIRAMRASDVYAHVASGAPGNGILGNFTGCTIGVIEQRRCAAGVKIYGYSLDTVVGLIYTDSCGTATVGNSGLKLQGDSTNGWYPTRVTVGEVICKNNTGTGLYIEQTYDCKVGQYTGYNNGSAAGGGAALKMDVWEGGTRTHIGSITTDTPYQIGVNIRYYSTNFSIGRVFVRNPQNSGLGLNFDSGATGGVGSIGELIVLDDQAVHTLARGISDFGTLTVCAISRYSATGYTVESAHVNSAGLTLPSTLPDVQSFTATGTWTKAAGAKFVTAALLAGGGAGGSGRRGASGTVCCGGGGGGGGGFASLTIPASLLTATVAVTIGAGGTGGAAVTTDDTNGNNGGSGAATTFGAYLRAQPGTSGSGGTATTGAAGSGGNGLATGGNGGAASTTGAIGNGGGTGSFAAPGGASGGGLATTPAAVAGGTGGLAVANNATTGGVGSAGAAGGAGVSVTAGMPEAGSGGGGGSSATTTAAFAGGNGGSYGAGGGGGGASLNTFNSGKGGDGAPGFCVVYSW